MNGLVFHDAGKAGVPCFLCQSAAHATHVGEAVLYPRDPTLILELEGFTYLLAVIGHEHDDQELANDCSVGDEADAIESGRDPEAHPEPEDSKLVISVRRTNAWTTEGPECDR